MQATEQYGVSDRFLVSRPPPALRFAFSQNISHGHPHHLLPTSQHQDVQQKHQQHQQYPQHHHSQPPQRTQHSQHPQHVQHPQQHVIAKQLRLGANSWEDPSLDDGDPSTASDKHQESRGDYDREEVEGKSLGRNRWSRQETLDLIKIRSDMDSNFRESNVKGPLWEDVSRSLAELGYQRIAKKCKEKFENVHKYYKKTKDGRGRQDGKSYRFFNQLEALYGGVKTSNIQYEDGSSFTLLGGSEGAMGEGEGPISSPRRTGNSSGLQLSSDPNDNDYSDPRGKDDDPLKSKKRKRKEGSIENSEKMVYFEILLKELVEKQETMQQKFLDIIELREHDRLAEEDAWRQHKMVQMTQEHELRAQEYALAGTRDAALVAFLQKVTGQTLQLPQMVRPQPLNLVIRETYRVENQHEEGFDLGKRWPKSEVHALIRLRSQLEPKIQEVVPKGPL